MKLFSTTALFSLSTTSFWALPALAKKPKSLRGSSKTVPGFSVADLMVRNQLSVPLQLTEAYYYAGPDACSYVALQFYNSDEELEYVDVSGGANTNLKSKQGNDIILNPPSTNVPGGYPISVADSTMPTEFPQQTNITMVFEPTEQVADLQVVVVNLRQNEESSQVEAQFLQGTYTSSEESFWKNTEDTETCNFNNGNTNVYMNNNLCGYLGETTSFACPTRDPNYPSWQACLPQSNSTTGFDGVVEGNLEEINALVTIDLTQVAYTGAYSNWQPVASSGSQSTSMTTSWSTSTSTTHNSTHSSSFSASVSESVGFKYGFASEKTTVGASTTQYVSESTSNTISQTNSGSTTVTCNPAPCNGILYQWNVNAADMYGNEANVQSCDFQCVPFLSTYYPRCPLGYCSSPACNCCNAIWKADDTSADGNYLDNRLDSSSSCVAFEVQYATN